MVTWQGNTPRSWPNRQQRSSISAGVIPREQDLDDADALHDIGELVEQAETALVPHGSCPPPGGADRLLADQIMVDKILEQGLGGPRHQALETALIQYSVPVLRKLLASGEIISKAARLKRPTRASAWLDFTVADREELARDMVADALPVFTKAVFEQRRWSPSRGATLKTYFVNACVMQFSRLYEDWLDQRRVIPAVALDRSDPSFNRALDPAVTIALRDEAIRLLKQIPDRQIRKALLLQGIDGLNFTEAAREVGLTKKAAENRLARIRKTLKKEQNDSEPAGNETPRSKEGGGRSGA